MTYSNACLIINPQAKHGQTGRLVDKARSLFERKLDLTVEVTARPGHAAALAEQAGDFDLVVAVGGDGTVHEVANGLVRGGHDRTVLGVLPTGSGNDYSHTMGLSKSIERAAEQILAGHTRRFDLGMVNDTYYVNSLGLGFDARVADKAIHLKQETGRTGLPLYMTALLEILWRDFYCHRASWRVDEGTWAEDDLVCIAAMIGPTYGGGFRIAPRAVPDDGLLDVCWISRLTRNQALVRLPLVVAGLHEPLKAVTALRAERLEVRSESPLPAVVDGEVVWGMDFRIRILPQARLVAVPPG